MLRTEDRYRPGYPPFSSFLGRYPEMRSFRRFGMVRMRLLLKQQDKIILLGQKLFNIHTSEEREIWLGSIRRDKNGQRTDVLRHLNRELKLYGEFQCFSIHKQGRSAGAFGIPDQ